MCWLQFNPRAKRFHARSICKSFLRMDISYESNQIFLFCKDFVGFWAFEVLLHFMNFFYVSIQVSYLENLIENYVHPKLSLRLCRLCSALMCIDLFSMLSKDWSQTRKIKSSTECLSLVWRDSVLVHENTNPHFWHV